METEYKAVYGNPTQKDRELVLEKDPWGYYCLNKVLLPAFLLIRNRGDEHYQVELWALEPDSDPYMSDMLYSPWVGDVFGWTSDKNLAYDRALKWSAADELPVLVPQNGTLVSIEDETGDEHLHLEFVEGGE